MGLVIRLLELLIVLVPLVGVAFAGVKGFSALRRRQNQRPEEGRTEPEREERDERASSQRTANWQSALRAIKEHDRTDTRWLEYELDVAKLLDFPLMTDLRDPLTERFHRSKLRADLLRPMRAEDMIDDRDAARDYLDAVEEYVTAFNIAETEAIRRGRNDFSRDEQQRLARAQSMLRMAVDSASSPQEREGAYRHAKRELDGLVVLPDSARAAIERAIAGELPQ